MTLRNKIEIDRAKDRLIESKSIQHFWKYLFTNLVLIHSHEFGKKPFELINHIVLDISS